MLQNIPFMVSTHSRAEAAAVKHAQRYSQTFSFNTQPRGGGCHLLIKKQANKQEFQHTAARRRLRFKTRRPNALSRFNTQPRGGGCKSDFRFVFFGGFQHTAARRRLLYFLTKQSNNRSFNTQPRGGGCNG